MISGPTIGLEECYGRSPCWLRLQQLLDIDWLQAAPRSVSWVSTGSPLGDTGKYSLFSSGRKNALLQIFMMKYEIFSIMRKLDCPLLCYFIFLEKSFKISSANFTNSMSINI